MNHGVRKFWILHLLNLLELLGNFAYFHGFALEIGILELE